MRETPGAELRRYTFNLDQDDHAALVELARFLRHMNQSKAVRDMVGDFAAHPERQRLYMSLRNELPAGNRGLLSMKALNLDSETRRALDDLRFVCDVTRAGATLRELLRFYALLLRKDLLTFLKDNDEGNA